MNSFSTIRAAVTSAMTALLAAQTAHRNVAALGSKHEGLRLSLEGKVADCQADLDQATTRLNWHVAEFEAKILAAKAAKIKAEEFAAKCAEVEAIEREAGRLAKKSPAQAAKLLLQSRAILAA
jgi:hypothetical protein